MAMPRVLTLLEGLLAVVQLAVVSCRAGTLKFAPPVIVGNLSGWGDSDGAVQFDGDTIIVPTSKGTLISTDGGRTHIANPGGNLPGGVLLKVSPGVLYEISPTIPTSRQGYNFTQAKGSYEISRSGGETGKITAMPGNRPATYISLPQLVTCKQGLRTDGCCGCPFRVGGHGNGGAVFIKRDGNYLQTVNVFFARTTQHQGPSSLTLYSSRDGLLWEFRALVANASHFPHSEEGPNESALVCLADGETLMVVMRMDGGDGPPDRRHSTLYQSFSSDDGKTWSTPAVMQPPAVLSVRPKLLMMDAQGPGKGPLLLTTGRPGIALWVNWDGMGRTWEMKNVAQLHNSMFDGGSAAMFSPQVVEGNAYFSPYQSSVYNSLVATNTSTTAVIYYNRRSIKGYEAPDAVYAMRITAEV
eukprot:scpid58650/ scgid24999/ 